MDRLLLVRGAEPVALSVHTSAGALPPDALALLDAAGRDDFQLGAAWFAITAAHALPPDATPLFLLWQEDGRAVALLPLQRLANGRLEGLTSPYTVRFQPPIAPGAAAAAIRRAGRGFGRFCRRHGPLRLDALDADWPGRSVLLAGFRAAGLIALRFRHFENWHLPLTAPGWPAYLAARPGELRETIRRRLAKAARDPSVVFDLVTGPDGLAPAIAAYEQVYAASWKDPEPYPGFGPAFLHAAAAAGVLRMGVLRRGGVPVAAQYWTLCGGTATVLKLAHDEAAKAISPGTVLTALMLRHLLDNDGARALDFGRGGDPYKAGWTGQMRVREGLLLCPLLHPAGLAALARHAAGVARRRWAPSAT